MIPPRTAKRMQPSTSGRKRVSGDNLPRSKLWNPTDPAATAVAEGNGGTSESRHGAFEPVDEIDVRRTVGRPVGAPLLDAAVPGANVLADVATVDLCPERLPVGGRDRLGCLRPVREALRRVER